MARIAFVDDDAVQLMSFRIALQNIGHEIEWYSDASDALDGLCATHASFDLVILDVMMPTGDGSLILDALRESKSLRTGITMLEYLMEIPNTPYRNRVVIISMAVGLQIEIEEAASKYNCIYLPKRKYRKPIDFARKIDEIIQQL